MRIFGDLKYHEESQVYIFFISAKTVSTESFKYFKLNFLHNRAAVLSHSHG